MSRLKLHVLRPKLCMLRPSLHVLWQNLASEEAKIRLSKSTLIIFEKFSKLFGIFNGENTLFTKSAQKMF